MSLEIETFNIYVKLRRVMNSEILPLKKLAIAQRSISPPSQLSMIITLKHLDPSSLDIF
jgi:hypothetical protein